ncbi:MAG: peptidase S8 [Frankiaceae bacterium]|nr:peptidase S8 [Frankiaceae bacterium]
MSLRSRTALATSIVVVGLITSGVASAQGTASEASGSVGSYTPGSVLVQYRPGVSGAEQAELERGQSAQRVGSIAALQTEILAVPVGAEDRVITALSRSGKVEYAERNGVAFADAAGSNVTNDTYLGQQWGVSKINTPTAWGTTTGSSSVVIGVVDTGADYSHPDLQGRLVAGYDFVNNDSRADDDQGHGTSTAGIIGAATNNGIGIAGMCWNCTIMPVKALNSSGSGSYSAIANAVTWATDHGADIINMSLGGGTDSSTLHNAITYAANKGVFLVGSAGNSGTTAYNYPAGYAEVLSVAGSTSTDGLYSWSNYGSWVDVAAPGCDYATSLGGGYNSNFCGTSAAAPVVSGMVGLLKSAAPATSNSALKSAITSTAVSMGTKVKYGRVDAAAAMAALGTTSAPDPTTSPTEPASTTYTGSLNGGNPSRSFSVTSAAGSLDATLTFSRSASMDLTLKDAAGRTVATATGGSPVSLTSSVAAGTYTLTVSGGRGSFSLEVTTP